MATSEDFFEYVSEQLAPVGEVSFRRMMGEYCVYYRGKTVGLICDNQLFLKPVPSVLSLFPDAQRGFPYEGSKTLMVIIDDFENTELMLQTFDALYREVPEAKRK